MKSFSSSREMQAMCRKLILAGNRIALVPTMGCLHEGHLSLMKTARERGNILAVSIFVNPIQFGKGEDYERYPRDIRRDSRLCAETGVDLLFCPEASDIYATDHSVFVDETVLSQGMCGSFRPGHFKGVTTVVAKLFNIVQPDVAVFGHKDIQQALIIKQLVRDLNFPIDVVIAPTVREADGLAMSSRNNLLTDDDRRVAPCLWKALGLAQSLAAGGYKDTAGIRDKMTELIQAEAPSACIDYIEFANCATLHPTATISGPTVVALAVRLGKVRLIDNLVIGERDAL